MHKKHFRGLKCKLLYFPKLFELFELPTLFYSSVARKRQFPVLGEARRLPHPPFCSARVPESVARHDRGVARKAINGKK